MTAVDTSKRPHKAYCAKTGEIVGFDHPIDLNQALSMGHVQLHKPGEDPGESLPNPARHYEGMSSDDLRKLCVARDIKGYMVLTREQQIQALRERDALETKMLSGSDIADKATDKLPDLDDGPDSERERLMHDADQLGLKVPHNIGIDKLREKVEAASTEGA